MRFFKDPVIGRRAVLHTAPGLLTGAAASGAAAQQPSAGATSGTTASGARPADAGVSAGRGVRVISPDIPTLPFEMDGGIKVFRLVAEPVKQEFLPGRV